MAQCDQPVRCGKRAGNAYDMREMAPRPSSETGENQESDVEKDVGREAGEPDDFDEALEAARSRGSELRTSREVATLVADVKREIARAFEHSRREQERFGDQVRSDAALRPRLERFLNFYDNLKRGESA